MATYGNKNIKNFYHQLEVEERAHIEKCVDKAVKIAVREMMKKTEKSFREMFRDAIDRFYQDYTPGGVYPYQRTNSLYNILDTEYLGEDAGYEYGAIAISFDDDKVTKFRNGNGSVYDLAFKEGWHGGAKSGDTTVLPTGTLHTPHPDPGTPYYRRMVKSRKHGRWFSVGWTRPAERTSPSPFDQFDDEIERFANEEMQGIYIESFNKHFSEILKEGW